jgi:hypothetical protein
VRSRWKQAEGDKEYSAEIEAEVRSALGNVHGQDRAGCNSHGIG